MFKISLVAAVLVVRALALSSAAFAGQVYQGGPKSGLTARVQSFEANKPYAQDLTARAGAHQGGPKMTAPHGQR
jgi:hypothetical protein